MKRFSIMPLASLVMIFGVAPSCLADIAVDMTLTDLAYYGAKPDAGTTMGWQFAVASPIVVTHLGLYDFYYELVYSSGWTQITADGFNSTHPIGLWRLSDGTLLASGTVPAGTAAPQIGRFRYIEVSETTLIPNEEYVVGFYTESSATSDPVATDPYNVTWNTDPLIDYVTALKGSSSGLTMPTQALGSDLRFGPNFQFTAVPVPASAVLGLIGLGAAVDRLRRHRRR